MSEWQYWYRLWMAILRRWHEDAAEVLRAAEERREQHCAKIYDMRAEREKRRMRA